jgi:hypothetical protein
LARKGGVYWGKSGIEAGVLPRAEALGYYLAALKGALFVPLRRDGDIIAQPFKAGEAF